MAEIAPEALLEAVRQCVTVVGPDQVLVVRVPHSVTDEELHDIGGWLNHASEATGLRAVAVRAESLGVADVTPDMFARWMRRYETELRRQERASGRRHAS